MSTKVNTQYLNDILHMAKKINRAKFNIVKSIYSRRNKDIYFDYFSGYVDPQYDKDRVFILSPNSDHDGGLGYEDIELKLSCIKLSPKVLSVAEMDADDNLNIHTSDGLITIPSYCLMAAYTHAPDEESELLMTFDSMIHTKENYFLEMDSKEYFRSLITYNAKLEAMHLKETKVN